MSRPGRCHSLAGQFGVLFLTLFVIPLYGQSEPSSESPDLVVPPFLLELEGEESEAIEAPLPEEELAPPPLSPLPPADPGAVVLPPLELELTPPPPEVVVESSDPESVLREFSSTGWFALGPGRRLNGGVSLLNLGETSFYSIGFEYAGGGRVVEGAEGDHVSRRYLLDANYRLTHPRVSLEVGGHYHRQDIEIVGSTGFEGNFHRYLGLVDLNLPFSSGRVGLSTTVDYLERWGDDSAETPVGGFEVHPELGYSQTWGVTTLEIAGDYRFSYLYESPGSGLSGLSGLKGHRIQGMLGLNFELPKGWEIGATGGAIWFPGGTLLWPFSIYLDGKFGRVGGFTLSGGYRNREYALGEMQQANLHISFYQEERDGVLELAPLMEDAHGWGGELELNLSPIEMLTATGKVGCFWWENYQQPGGELGSGESSLVMEGLTNLKMEFFLALSFHRNFRLSAGWRGQGILDRDTLLPENDLSLLLEFGREASLGEEKRARWGGRVGGVWSLYPDGSPYESQLPEVELLGYYYISEGFRIILEAKDVLEPLIQGGRTGWLGLPSSGMEATLAAEISY